MRLEVFAFYSSGFHSWWAGLCNLPLEEDEFLVDHRWGRRKFDAF